MAAQWGGFGCSLDADTFAEQAAALYTDEATWQQCQDTGAHLPCCNADRVNAVASVKRMLLVSANSRSMLLVLH